MCLITHSTVKSWQAGLFVPVKKVVDVVYYSTGYYYETPFTNNRVTTIMTASYSDTNYDAYIGKKAVHSFYSQKAANLMCVIESIVLDVYAIGVFALNHGNKEVASLGIYYPQLNSNLIDVNKLKKMNYERRLKYLTQFVPFLKHYKELVCNYQANVGVADVS